MQAELAEIVRAVGFGDVPGAVLDVAVIELNAAGSPVAEANVLLSDGKIQFPDPPGAPDPPFPASLLKLMVAIGVLRLADSGAVDLGGRYDFDPAGAPNDACGGPASATIREYLDAMITWSSNPATCALVKLLHERSAVDPLNALFAARGLDLSLAGTRPVDGGGWSGARMTAWSTARLLLTGPELVSAGSWELLLRLLGEQGLNHTLSTANFGDLPYPAAGIPQRVAERWIDPESGAVTVGRRAYGVDIRAGQRLAEVSFAHKTGLTIEACCDAGIVHALPGKPGRDYIVAMLSNRGSHERDPHRPAGSPMPNSEKFAQLGRAIDELMLDRRLRQRR
ncbi:MAG: hypothetical protein JWO79_390 [Actinomycetia bacterium]|nr:hypothetical protein [Actinomycetes bacterium]